MKVNFMGLTGPEGVLPLYYTSLLAERTRAGDHSAVDFFDIFNHRIISLFYLAWEKYRFSVAYEREGLDPFSHHLMDLIGLGTPGLQNRLPVLDDSLLYYSGLLAQRPRSATALRNLLSDYFEFPSRWNNLRAVGIRLTGIRKRQLQGGLRRVGAIGIRGGGGG